MKMVITSDWHADHTTYGVPRYKDVAQAVKQTVRAAKEQKVDAYCFVGDLADPDDAPRALRAARLAIETATELAAEGIASYWLAGNHDVIEDGSGETTLSCLRPVAEGSGGMVHLFERPMFGPDAGFNLVALPYTASSHAYDPGEFLREWRLLPRQPTIILSHLTKGLGIAPGEETTEMPRGREVEFPADAVEELAQGGKVVVMQGHWHKAQTFCHGSYNVHVPGSLARLTFSEEAHEPSFIILDLD